MSTRPFAIVGVVIVLGAGAVYWMHANAESQRQEREAAIAAQDAADGKLAQSIRARLAPLAKAGIGSAPDTGCPAAVSGELPLVDEAWLQYLVAGGAKPDLGDGLRSPVFEYLTGLWLPGEPRAYAQRHRLYESLATAPYLIVSRAETTKLVVEENIQFDGGRTTAILAIADLQKGAFVCDFAVGSAPDTIVAVKQPSPRGAQWDTDTAARQAIARAFWRDTASALAGASPMSTVAAPALEDM